MASERENQLSNNGYGTLKLRRYDIADNDIRAFYDADNRLVFVIDDTITSAKPNALLVIGPVGNRKWDDILANDYGVILESIRPKKDNKYQKLDIEYAGLSAYDNLIQRFGETDDLESELAALAAFRADASRNAALERLAMANTMAENARATIDKSQDVIDDLNVRMRALRSKLSKQRSNVGREPTKQSAAKILRTESQIDAARGKLERANKRMANAQRRLAAAENDADIAREILAQYDGDNSKRALVKSRADKGVPARVKSNPVAKIDDFDDDTDDVVSHNEPQKMIERDVPPIEIPVFQSVGLENTNYTDNNNNETKADDMADEEVKPLFDKDPEILDEEIAFKPIDFNIPTQTVADDMAPVRSDMYSDVVSSRSDVAPAVQSSPAPLSFTPPASPAYDNNVSANDAIDAGYDAPVLDRLTPAPAQTVAPTPRDYSAIETDVAPAYSGYDMPSESQSNASMAAATSRPVSPLGASPVTPTVGVVNSNAGRRPNIVYYVMLLALIILSIFTLWVYQRGNTTAVPDLAAVETAKESDVGTTDSKTGADENPFFEIEETTVVQEPVQPVVPVEEPAPIEEAPVIPAEPEEPVDDTPAAAVPPVVEEPTQDTDSPFLTEPVPEAEPVSIIPPIVNKPAYTAGSQQEKMFVADESYETDGTPATSYVAEETVVQSDGEQTCSDGAPADADGCCGGEELKNINGEFMCCSLDGAECFPPMQ